jgi:protease IV
MLDPFSPQDEAQRAYIQSMLGEIHAQFIAVVKRGRGDRLKETPDTFSGLVWSGQRAVEQGLADGLGSVDYVAREIVKAEEIVDYTQRENVGMRLARELGVHMGEGVFKAARSAGISLR